MIKKTLLFIIALSIIVLAQPFPDQFYTHEKEDLIAQVESVQGIEVSPGGKKLVLSDGVTSGYVVFQPDSSDYPFDIGLPSWNGHSPNDKSSFKVLMRFYNGNWSPWLTIGFWKNNIWTSYGTTTYNGGEINIDWAVLNSYNTKWQFQVVMKRTSVSEPSPNVYKLSFFASDHRTTDNVNISSILNDKPAQIFIPTDHIYQYSIDPEIGGDICSPTSVCMVLRSYDIPVDPLQFAEDNYDSYWGIFGIWPKAVQHAAEFGLRGAVKQYRNWSQAREVLAAGGRIVMSVGYPLYPSGHLLMLAGFTSQGNPLVHDPARSNGYGYMFNKTQLSQSWFNKGGIAYTFFPEDTSGVTSLEDKPQLAENFKLGIYPNPFNPQTNIIFEIAQKSYTEINVYDISGREVANLFKGEIEPGSYNFAWNAPNFSSGMYFIRVISGNHNKTVKAILLK